MIGVTGGCLVILGVVTCFLVGVFGGLFDLCSVLLRFRVFIFSVTLVTLLLLEMVLLKL